MKKLLVVVILVACAAAFAFASLQRPVKKDLKDVNGQKEMKQTEKKEVKKKKECRKVCWFS